jgi:hypothetical protein
MVRRRRLPVDLEDLAHHGGLAAVADVMVSSGRHVASR